MRNRHFITMTAMAAAGILMVTGCAQNTQTTALVQTTEAAAETAVEIGIETEEEEMQISDESGSNVLRIAEQGIFSAGGTVITSQGTFNPEDHWEESGAGQTAHVDHANVLYQIPEEETGLPMVFLHGYGQSRMGGKAGRICF